VVDILPRAQNIDIPSAAAPGTVLERLRGLVANWRHTALAPAALRAGVLGWVIHEDASMLVVRPRPAGSGIPVAIFEGAVAPSAGGSIISGRIRLHTGARLFLVAVVAFAALAPLGALFDSMPREDWHGHVVRAAKMLPISVAVAGVAVLMLRGGLYVLGRQIRALLDAAAQGR
jgi:hypothetical protein